MAGLMPTDEGNAALEINRPTRSYRLGSRPPRKRRVTHRLSTPKMPIYKEPLHSASRRLLRQRRRFPKWRRREARRWTRLPLSSPTSIRSSKTRSSRSLRTRPSL